LGLLPIYLRGKAYLQQKAGKQASVEFQKIIDPPGVAQFSPLQALARLGLARAYALGGDRENSRSEYQEFFQVWKDADSDIPHPMQAKAEYRRQR
jgi:eukaryotic-like serine/threonine-protein kinase